MKGRGGNIDLWFIGVLFIGARFIVVRDLRVQHIVVHHICLVFVGIQNPGTEGKVVGTGWVKIVRKF